MSFFSAFFNLKDGEGEKAVLCPFPHSAPEGQRYLETHPSAHVNTTKELFHCKVCGEGLNEAQFIAKILGCSIAEGYKIQKCFQTTESEDEWDEEVSLNDASRERALKLGIGEQVLKELKIGSPGLTDNRIAFPVFMFGHLCDIRIYDPGNKPKVRSRSGSPAGLIIPFDIWRKTEKNKWTLLCAGEKDMSLARTNGFNAITLTGGEGASPSPINFFRDRHVAIVYDNDGAGLIGAHKLARTLSAVTSKIKIVTGFHEVCKEKGEDITDFFTKYGKTRDDLIHYIEETPWYDPQQDDPPSIIAEDPEEEENENTHPGHPILDLSSASRPNNINTTIKTNVQVVSTAEEVFSCVSSIHAEKFKEAGQYDTMMPGATRDWRLTENTLKDILHLIDNNFSETKIDSNIRDILKIPEKEKYVSIKKLERVTVYKAYVTDLYETTDDIQSQPVEYTVYSIGKKLESGQKYMITHRLVPHPYKGQQLVSIAIDYKKANDSVSDFVLSDEAKANLAIIRNEEGTIKEKIAKMVERVKGIIGYNGNNQLIETIDLSFNTVLSFNFGVFRGIRGYLDTFIVSESRVGKSSTCDALRRTYGLGTITSLAGNSATIPGLIGGSNKTATGYQTKAGIIPQNHKGLIIFEEFGKSNHQISSELTEIRSSNQVRIARISGTITMPAMVRMITLTNPKTIGGQIKSISSYPNGIAVLTELVDTAEDIARYDVILILGDRGANQIDPLWTPQTPLADEVYRTRIRWIWSRRPDQIIISPEVAKYIVDKANELNETYDCHIKIFGTEAWKKIARLAIAVAGYTVSTDDSYENIIVTNSCVEYAVEFYKRLYDNPTFKFKEYAAYEKQYCTIDYHGVCELQKIFDECPMVVLQLEQAPSTTRNILQSATGLSHDEMSKYLNRLAKNLFIKFSGYDILPTERFRLGLSQIDREEKWTKEPV